MSVEVVVGIGSNINREANIEFAIQELTRTFGPLRLSPVYDAAAVGFNGQSFLNLVAAFATRLPLKAIQQYLKQLELRTGRRGDEPKYSGRTLDIDILLYGEQVGWMDDIELPRPEITRNAYVLAPMADLFPERLHPGSDQSYRQLWDHFTGERRLQRSTVQFSFNSTAAPP